MDLHKVVPGPTHPEPGHFQVSWSPERGGGTCAAAHSFVTEYGVEVKIEKDGDFCCNSRLYYQLLSHAWNFVFAENAIWASGASVHECSQWSVVTH